MTTLTDFLLARIAEDEEVARADIKDIERDFGTTTSVLFSGLSNVATGYMEYPAISIDSTRVLAECEAKRRMVDNATNMHTSGPDWDEAVRLLALPYADHDGYDEAWRP